MTSFGVIANRSFLFHEAEVLLFEQPNQFAEFSSSGLRLREHFAAIAQDFTQSGAFLI
jgi:hypothetical protein